VRVTSPTALTVHTDGEMFCTPDQNVRQIEVRLLPSRLSAKVCPLEGVGESFSGRSAFRLII
jgi:hypothetical protein